MPDTAARITAAALAEHRRLAELHSVQCRLERIWDRAEAAERKGNRVLADAFWESYRTLEERETELKRVPGPRDKRAGHG